MKKVILNIIFLLGTTVLFSQVTMQVDTTHIRIGEQIEYKISTENKPKVVFPKLKLDSLKKVEVVHDSGIDTLKNRLYKKYILTSFDSGNYVIPAQEVFIDNQRFLTDSLLIHVGTVAVDTTKQGLFPIKPIHKAPPKTWHEYLYILWWILGILVLIWWFAFRSKKLIQFKPKVVLTPFDVAINQLKELDEKNLIGQQKIKEYYTELTDIVRKYIEEDVKIAAMEVTSDELITLLKKYNKLKKLGISANQINHLQLFLSNADMVKFAKGKPETEHIIEDRNFAEVVLKDFKTVVQKPQFDELGNPIVPELEKEELKVKTSRKRRWFGVGVGVGLLLVVLIGSAWYFGIQYVKDTLVGHPTKELLEGKWYRNSYGYPSVSIETPVVLKANNEFLPPEVSQMTISASNFGYGSLLSGFYIILTTAEFDEQMELNMDEAVQGAVQNVQSQKGVSDLEYQVEDLDIENQTGKKIVGTLKANGENMHFVQYLFNKKNVLQQIVIMRKSNDVYAEKIERRILQSVKF